MDPVDDYRALNDPVRRRQVERRGGYFVVEGAFALEALLDSRYPIRSVLVTERRAARVRALVDGRAPVHVRSDDEVAAIAGFAFHRGVLAAADRLPLPQVADIVARARLVAVVEAVGDHENLGALFRNAAAFGVDAVLLDPTTADPLYRRSVRVSLGHVLRVPWTRVGPLPAGLEALTSRRFEVAALTPSRDAQPIEAYAAEVTARRQAAARAAGPPGEAPTGGVRVALVVGAEGPGLSAATLAAADRTVRIAMAPGVDSLNVATAAAIAFHRLA
ncbi:MAG: RNA methyltransferase [Acidimicrobiales bacterium]|nr:RNA methyltransferase [Acidimicrobiales bacterium]